MLHLQGEGWILLCAGGVTRLADRPDKLTVFSFFLSRRLVLPLLQSYLTAGDFTPWQKFRTSVRANAVGYLSIGVIAAGLLIYITVRNNLSASGLEQVRPAEG